jgi:hypothetical protein
MLFIRSQVHVCPGFNPSNINHELCHYADDVTLWPGFNPSEINHELCHYADDVTLWPGFNPSDLWIPIAPQKPNSA